MRFAISIPQTVAGASFDPTGMDTYLAQAEELGFDSAWTGEQLLGTQPMLSPLETLAYAAARTRQIRLGCAMVVSPLHNPVHLAKTIASHLVQAIAAAWRRGQVHSLRPLGVAWNHRKQSTDTVDPGHASNQTADATC
ncbi:LLM class flavin-dependent oxidoreductase [Actinopolymorpha pittospori]|uniref:Luciferase-like domain-containing protein n=1 Tax=Actinopolymorpha pittospori TaxID=648752 RepID=A0A927MP73_9ACTN|nr:LLM class flavin-dependent oxidoreductase [Actinopolymorpha pittospori]MBE1603851.1 hypothetical protein [Actinopolymorpha pittospori]